MSSPAQKQEPLAIASFVLACLALVLGPIAGIPAIICGHISRNKIRNRADLPGYGLATAGLIMGYLLSVLGILLVIARFFLDPGIHQ